MTTGLQPATLSRLTFEPGYAALGPEFVEERLPTPLPAPQLVAFNADVAALLDLPHGLEHERDFIELAAGNVAPAGAHPTAAVYAGHQFGTYVPQLGDGRAITLGELANARGEHFEWQLKGSGTTAFSRFGDGRAVLRSSVREYLCSEAMHALGIPTTRALAIVGSPEPVQREVVETAAVLSRIAPSHLRFGTFEYFHYTKNVDAVRTLADYAVERFFPDVAALTGAERYAAFLRAVAIRTADLVARWQAAGFAHGVMNTDNMSVLGLTLDYGPFGFMEAYDPSFVCNHSDHSGRYAFDRQPGIALWNCQALAAALRSLVSKAEAEAALDAFEPTFRATFLAAMRAKLGLVEQRPEDARLIVDLLDLLASTHTDYSQFFASLGALDQKPAAFDAWLQRYRDRAAQEGDEQRRATVASRANPRYVLRNHLAQAAIEAAEGGDYGEIARLHALLREPFREHAHAETYAGPAPAGAVPICVSCSS